jgi:hypothetical protein
MENDTDTNINIIKNKKYIYITANMLLSLSLIALGLASDRWILIIPFFFVIALTPLFQEKNIFKLGFIGKLFLALPFAILSRSWEVPGTAFDFTTMFYIALYLQALAVLRFYSGEIQKIIPGIAGYTAVGIAGCGVKFTDDIIYLVLCVLYSLTLFFALRLQLSVNKDKVKPQKFSIIAIASTFILTITVTVISVLLLRTYYRDINRLFVNWVRNFVIGTSVGFSDSAKLGSITGKWKGPYATEIALRAFSESAPGYLRGKTFSTYTKGEWLAFGGATDKNTSKIEGGKTGERLFVFENYNEPLNPDAPDMRVITDSRYKAHFFLPLNTSAVITRCEKVGQREGNILLAKRFPTTKGYGIFTQKNMPVINEVDKRFSILPQNDILRYTLRNTIKKFSRKAATTKEKVIAIKNFFATYYKYKLGITFVETGDPMVQFLTYKKHGHCELFASAGTLLLRYLNVPARYVTGFVCEEKNEYGNVWIARDKHAHAWVEYYDSVDKKWKTAEFTPPAGLPTMEKPLGANDLWEYITSLWTYVKGLGFSGIVNNLMYYLGKWGEWLIGAWWRVLLLVILLGAFIYQRTRGKVKHKSILDYRSKFPDKIEEMRRKFAMIQKDLSAKHLGKEDDETLENYAGRILQSELEDKERIAAFIKKFSQMRYSNWNKDL